MGALLSQGTKIMKISTIVAATAALGVAACGSGRTANQQAATANMPEASQPQANQQVYSGTGTIKSISGDQVTISHGPIAGIGWPAMTMTFTVPDDLASEFTPGSQVDFSFRESAGQHVLTAIRKH